MVVAGTLDGVDAVSIARRLDRTGHVIGLDAAPGMIARALTADGRIGVVTTERAGGERNPFVRAYEWVYRHVPGYQRVGCRPTYARRTLEVEGFEIECQERHRRGYVWPADILIARAP